MGKAKQIAKLQRRGNESAESGEHEQAIELSSRAVGGVPTVCI